jgi:hypothetical protein
MLKSKLNPLWKQRLWLIQLGGYFVLVILAACSDKTLPKFNELNSIRVLALIAQPPEVNPGSTVTVTPVVSDIYETAGLSFSSFACLDYGIALGAEPTCTGNPTRVTLTTGTLSTLSAVKAFTGAADSVTLTVPDFQNILALRNPAQQYNGVGYIFEYILQNSRGGLVRSFKRLLVSDSAKTTKNSNPDISDMLFNGAVVVGLPLSVEVATSLNYNGTPTESFQKMNSDYQITSEVEELVTTWFITDGKMNYQRTIGLNTNNYEGPPNYPVGRPAYIIGITRDGRGGADYTIKCFGTCN